MSRPFCLEHQISWVPSLTVQASVVGSARTTSHTLSLSAKPGTAPCPPAGVEGGWCLQLSHYLGLLKWDSPHPTYLVSHWKKFIFFYKYFF